MTLGVSLLAGACSDEPDDGGAVNRAGLGSAPRNPALDAIGARYIVKFRDASTGRAALQAAGAQVVLELAPQQAAAAHIPAQALAGLSNHPGIEYLEEDALRRPLGSGTVETVPYGIPMVQADQVTPGTGAVKVCIVDSGYHRAHDDLADTSVNGTNNSGTGNWYEDTCGHGSHVAGTISAPGGNGLGVVGVYPGANLHIVKVFNGADCAWTYSSNLVAALNACKAAKGSTEKMVVSMSLGGSFSSRTESNAFQTAYSEGILSVAAAGNDGSTRKSYPASYSSVISVAAIDSGKLVADFSQKNDAVELAAPGVAVESTVPWLTDASVTVNGVTYRGFAMEFAATTSGVTGALVDGGLCDTAGSWTGKLVICQRGTTSFAQKVDIVIAGGGVGAVIYNNAAGSYSGTLSTAKSLPAISLSDTDGAALLASAGQSGTLVNQTVTPASGYEAWDGTSMATPHVSAVAALVWSNASNKTNADLRAALTASAEDLGAAGKDTSYGYGLVRAKAALDALTGGGGTCTPSELTEVSCADGLDNDCDGLIDALDSNCTTGSCKLKGASCTANSDCCSGSCGGKTGQKTCK